MYFFIGRQCRSLRSVGNYNWVVNNKFDNNNNNNNYNNNNNNNNNNNSKRSFRGPKVSIATDIDLIKSKGSEIGLILNVSKCEVISHLTVRLNQQFYNFISTLPQDV